MSGGSFNYVCFKVETEEIFAALPDLREMESYLRGRGKHDAADEILKFILNIETARRRLDVQGRRLQDLLQSVEWWVSGDWSEEDVDNSLKELGC